MANKRILNTQKYNFFLELDEIVCTFFGNGEFFYEILKQAKKNRYLSPWGATKENFRKLWKKVIIGKQMKNNNSYCTKRDGKQYILKD